MTSLLTLPTFRQELLVLCETFGRLMGEPGFEGYWRVVGKMAEDDFVSACRSAVEDLDEMPSPGKLFELGGGDRTTGTPRHELAGAGRWAFITRPMPE